MSAFEGAGQGIIVGVFKLRAEGEPVSKAGNFDAERRKELVQIQGGLLSLKVGVSGQDDLLYYTIL